MSVGALGNPLRFQFTADQAPDITQAEALLLSAPIEHVIADKWYDAKAFVQVIRERGAVPTTSPQPTSVFSTSSAPSSGYDEMPTVPSNLESELPRAMGHVVGMVRCGPPGEARKHGLV